MEGISRCSLLWEKGVGAEYEPTLSVDVNLSNT